MSDFALVLGEGGYTADLAIEANDFSGEEGLRTAVLLSLYTDAGQWWADSGVPVVPGDDFGSHRHENPRAKRTPDVLSREQENAARALAWMVEDRVASSVDVAAEFMDRPVGVALQVTINRTGQDSVSYRFARAWATEEAR